jgi:hypothetical protein
MQVHCTQGFAGKAVHDVCTAQMRSACMHTCLRAGTRDLQDHVLSLSQLQVDSHLLQVIRHALHGIVDALPPFVCSALTTDTAAVVALQRAHICYICCTVFAKHCLRFSATINLTLLCIGRQQQWLLTLHDLCS